MSIDLGFSMSVEQATLSFSLFQRISLHFLASKSRDAILARENYQILFWTTYIREETLHIVSRSSTVRRPHSCTVAAGFFLPSSLFSPYRYMTDINILYSKFRAFFHGLLRILFFCFCRIMENKILPLKSRRLKLTSCLPAVTW